MGFLVSMFVFGVKVRIGALFKITQLLAGGLWDGLLMGGLLIALIFAGTRAMGMLTHSAASGHAFR